MKRTRTRLFPKLIRIAETAQISYIRLMTARSFRHNIAVVIAIIGLAATHVVSGLMDPVSLASPATGDSPSSMGCHGCSDGMDSMLAASCAAICGVVIAIVPASSAIEDSAARPGFATVSRTMIGLQLTPDPDPPRPASLS